MNVKELLDTDVEVAGGWLRDGFHWWLEELSQLMPQQLRFQRKPGAVAWTDLKRMEFRDAQGARLTGDAQPAHGAAVLSPDLYLLRRIELPAMRLADVRKLVDNELDRLTPFRKEDVWYDVRVGERNEVSGTQTVELGVLPRDTAERVETQLKDAGFKADALRAGHEPGAALDFLPAMRGRDQGTIRPYMVWLAVAALFLFNIAVMIVRDVNQLDGLREATASQAQIVDLARRLRGRIDVENTQRAQLLEARSQTAPLKRLADVTRALPAGAWVQTLTWDGRDLHLVGSADPGIDVSASLKRLTSRITSNAPAGTIAAGGRSAFDLTLHMGAP